MPSDPLVIGLHESLVTEALRSNLSESMELEIETGTVEPADLPETLARHIYATVRQAFSERSPQEALDLANQLINTASGGSPVADPATQLLRATPLPGPGVTTYPNVRPRTPLNETALLTNAKSEPSLGPELRTEIDTCDRVDLVCAFVRWAGLRLLEEPLRRLRERGGQIRVITTTYTGSTERKALDHLVREFGAEVKVQYDAQRTRLHAKAWMFHRDTGFDTAYVGSSNLTNAAMLEGVEWNVRLSKVATPGLLAKFNATFDTYWNDTAFEFYQPDDDADRLDLALAEAGGSTKSGRTTLTLSGLEVRPYPYQQEMLDDIEAERVVHDRHRNLVVAATGTGKTVVAALDYRRLCPETGPRPSLLFVAHRKEILEQSLRTYREVLGDGSFGELYVDGQKPETWRHVFASIQSLNSDRMTEFSADAFDVVVIDEFHHAEAKSYRRLLNHVNPRELLGLTATPERSDGVNVRDIYFGGRTATELRLWDALGAELLCPFHYFGIADNTDLTNLTWKRGRYDDTELTNLLTGNSARTRLILKELHAKVLDTESMRALGFCVSVSHARYMAEEFNSAGIPAAAVIGETNSPERAKALQELRDGTVNVLFTVDLFNEGIDIPSVDTVLFLRPTESATVFLQQLGRGLRRTVNKAVLTVLDFVGHQRSEFRWDLKLTAMTGMSRKKLIESTETGFPYLPSGCQMVLDRTTQASVLTNLKAQLNRRWPDLVRELKSLGNIDLATYLDETGAALSDVVAKRSWTQMRRDADLEQRPLSNLEPELLKRGRAFVHVDDPVRLEFYSRILAGDLSRVRWSPPEQRLAQMLFFSVWPNGGGHEAIADGLEQLQSAKPAVEEMSTLVDLAFSHSHRVTYELDPEISASVPLRVHARYRREEIHAAVGASSMTRKPSSFREGVLWVPDTNIDALLITLHKTEAQFSPSTMYRDYPISPTLFHWESQSGTTQTSPTGQRYINGTSNVLLFVRNYSSDEYGSGAPYIFLGRAHRVSHEGEKPITITWRLETPMPTDFFNEAKVVAI